MSEQAYYRYDYQDEEAVSTGLITVATNWIGAIVSLALVGSMGYYGYKLTMRDVTEVPVVRALEGPSRVQPDDPGGTTTAHQGLAVNEVQASGAVENPATRVILAPEPVRLTDEDMPSKTGALKPVPSLNGQEPTNMTDVIADENGDTPELSVADLIAEDMKNPDAGRLALLPGVKRSPRPRARVLVASTAPMSLVDVGAGTESAQDGTDLVDIDPSMVPQGARLVQLGAFDDRASAIREWDHVMERHGDLIGSRKRLIQEAESGGRSFFRLRMVGFEDIGDSRRLCSALLARGTPCIPVTAR